MGIAITSSPELAVRLQYDDLIHGKLYYDAEGDLVMRLMWARSSSEGKPLLCFTQGGSPRSVVHLSMDGDHSAYAPFRPAPVGVSVTLD